MNINTELPDNYLESHYINRSNWLRAAVLGANDGILSTSSLAIGIAAASNLRGPIILATLAGLVAGALSMAAGEYVSVSSQTDVEKADLEYSLYGFALFFLIILGAVAAKTGGSSIRKAVIRITFWGTVAMGLTALVGYLFNAYAG